MTFMNEEHECINAFEERSERLISNYFKTDLENMIIYHYTSMSTILKILKTASLRFTECSYLNDYTEGFYVFDLLKEVIKSSYNKFDLKFLEKINNELDNSPYNDIYDEECKYYFVSCFSEKDDELTLWNYYTKDPGMQGFNIHFDFLKLYKDINRFCMDNDFGIEPYKILYDEVRQKEYITNLLSIGQELFHEYRYDKICRFILNHLYSIRYAFKNNGFRNEYEIRCVVKLKESAFNSSIKDGNSLIELSPQNLGLAPYMDIHFNKECITGFTASPLVEQESRESIKFALLKYGYSPALKIEPSKIPLRFKKIFS